MGSFGLFKSGRNARLLADLSAELAVRSHDSVWTLVSERAPAMPPAEARGYTRARARVTIERQSKVVLRGYPETTAAMREQVTKAALEHVVSSVMRELVSLPARDSFRRRVA
jgi:hypothetical protein